MKLNLLASFLVGTALLLAAAPAQESPALFPYAPAQLLGVLPTAPEGWKITQSEADTSLGEWLETRATRVFQAPPTATETTTPMEIEISVVDTAGFAPAIAAFADFRPLKTETVEKKTFGNLPAIVTTGAGGKQFTQLLVASRYLVEITLDPRGRTRLEDWLRTFHFDTLPPAPSVPTTRPREFRLVHLDELNPKNDRSYTVSTTQAKRLDAFLKTLPAEVADAGAARTP